jgi:ATP-dependent protease Clp ATPase subunit
MSKHPKVWLKAESGTRPITVAAVTVNCPFCEEPLGSVLGGGLPVGMACGCGAQVVSVSDSELAPTPPAVLSEACRLLKQRLSDRVSGHDEILGRMALMGARHLHLRDRQRALLIGPSGTGKTTIAVALAEALGCPAVVWDASVSAEVGWSGVSITEVLAEMYAAYDGDLGRLRASVLIADEIDKLAVGDAVGSARHHKIGQMKSLLGLLGGGVPVRFQEGGDRGRTIALNTDDMLILGMGTFHGIPEDPGPGDLVSYGFTIEFAGRFPVVLRLRPLGPDHLVEILRREVSGSVAAASEFGYTIQIPPAVLRYVATAVADGGEGVTPRAGAGWLVSAVDTVLLRLIDLDARPGTRAVLRADDVPIPAPVRGRAGPR